MARECRNLGEWFDGPHEAPDPDKAARGRIAEIMARAREQDVRDIVLDVRTTPSGTTTSKSVFDKPIIIKADHDPTAVCDALYEQIQEVVPESFAGQLRVIGRARTGGNGDDLGSFAKMLRPPPPSATSMAEGGRQTGVIVIREPDAVKPWMDQLMRITGHVERMAGHVVTLFSAVQPKPPDTMTQAALQLLPSLVQGGRPPQGAAPGAPPGPQLPPPPPMRASWPFESAPAPAAPANTSVSMVSLDVAANQPAPAPAALTYEQVREWGIQNPELSRRLVMEAMTAHATTG